MTYIRLRKEFVYLTLMLDAYSQRLLGWALEPYSESELTLSALRRAVAPREVEPALVHHSDQGVPYASGQYTDLRTEHGMRSSMSRRGTAYAHAQAESFIQRLKYEEVYLYECEALAEARERIGYFIENENRSIRNSESTKNFGLDPAPAHSRDGADPSDNEDTY